MQQSIQSDHYSTGDGTPDGGVTQSTGLLITWQRGPLGRGEDRKEPNGAFVETVIRAAADRLEYYQGSRFACDENIEALRHLDQALAVLASRTAARESRGVEGTAQV